MTFALLFLLAMTLIGVIVLIFRQSSQGSQQQLQSLEQISSLKENLLKTLSENQLQASTLTQRNMGEVREEMRQSISQLQSFTHQRLQEIQTQVQTQLKQNLDQNFGAFQEMSKGLASLQTSAGQMVQISQQVNELNHLLASPKLQGNFGEVVLEQLLIDILPQSSYQLQPKLAEGCQPDAVIQLQDQFLCIDSKFPKDRYTLLINEAISPEQRAQALKELSQTVRGMIKDIAQKYIRPDLKTVDFALLFIPSEVLYYELLRMSEITELCRKSKVSISSPNTVAALLHSVALAFRNYEMQKNAKDLIVQIQELHKHFEGFRGDFNNLGKRISQAQEDFLKAQRDLERFDRSIARIQEGNTVPE
ncbi:MAG: DNA recombination protein RmuC [Verrucomicrobiota bacterium]